MRFAFYGRVGTDTLCDPENSIPHQRAACERSIDLSYPGSRIVGDFVDEGYGGRDYHRPALQKLLRAALNPKKKFDHVIVFDIARIARGAEILDVVEKLLASKGVAIFEALDTNDPRKAGTSLGREVEAMVAECFRQDRFDVADIMKKERRGSL